MNEASVAERLKSFIEFKGLSYAQFADTCGIPRPSLSQLLTGRNKKINDNMVRQIHNAFPDLSVVWLLFGEGPMEMLPRETVADTLESGSEFDEGIFAFQNFVPREEEIGRNPTNSKDGSKKSDSQGLKNDVIDGQPVEIKVEKLQLRIKELQSQLEKYRKFPRKAIQITVYYDDSTFETFFPR